MKAILMAAGIGTRISKSIDKHKSMLDIGNISIIRHTVKMLLDHNIEVAVVVGFRKEELYAELDDLAVKFFWNPFYRVTNSMASLWFAHNFISTDEDLILANADVFWENDILDELMQENSKTIMLVDSSRADIGDYIFKTENGKIVNHGKDLPMDERSCEYVGIAKLPALTLEVFKERLNILVGKDLYNLWWENTLYEYSKIDPVYVHDIKGKFWNEVDYIEDYSRILKYIQDKTID